MRSLGIIDDHNTYCRARTGTEQSSDKRAASPMPWLLQVCATAYARRQQRRARDAGHRIQ
jgi:hypothetical protein